MNSIVLIISVGKYSKRFFCNYKTLKKLQMRTRRLGMRGEFRYTPYNLLLVRYTFALWVNSVN